MLLRPVQTQTQNIGHKLNSETSPAILPDDEYLAGLGEALNTGLIASLIAPAIGVDASALTIRPYYVRYKRRENCLVGYQIELSADALAGARWPVVAGSYVAVKFYTDEHYPKARAKAESRRWTPEGLEKPYVCSDELRAVCAVFPNDFLLEGLRVISNQKKLQRLFYMYLRDYPEREWRVSDRRLALEVASYKPERRAVLRCATRATHRSSGEKHKVEMYLRVYADDRGEHIAKLTKELAEEFQKNSILSVPAALGYLPDRSAALVSAAPGVTLAGMLDDESEEGILFSAVGAVARALAGLHGAKTRALSFPHSSASELEVSRVSASLKDWQMCDERQIDEIAEELVSLKRKCVNGKSVSSGLAHGDFHPGQTLLDDDKVSLIDFDRAHTGDQLRDLGEFCARLVFASRDNESRAQALEEAFIGAYTESGQKIDTERLRFWKAHRLFSLAQAPLRELWPDSVKTTQWTLEKCRELIN